MVYSFETTQKRSELMKKIKSKNTASEIIFTKELWKRGVRYRRNYKELPGKPDVAITKYKIAVFIDGEFWHGYKWEEKKNKIAANREYWIEKIEKNIKRDLKNNETLRELGWSVIRFWEKEIKSNVENCVNQIIHEIESYKCKMWNK